MAAVERAVISRSSEGRPPGYLHYLRSSTPTLVWIPVLATIGLLAYLMKDLSPDFPSRQIHVRSGLLLAALGLCFAFDDTAAPVTGTSPKPLRGRRIHRLALSTLPWALAIGLILWAATQGGLDPAIIAASDQPYLPIGRLAVEAIAKAVLGLGLAAWIGSRWTDEPGNLAAVALLGLDLTLWAISLRWTPAWADPLDGRWGATLEMWGAVIAIGAIVTTYFSWDVRRSGLTPITFPHRWRVKPFRDTHADRGRSEV